MQIYFREKRERNLHKLSERLKQNGKVSGNEFLLRFSPNDETAIVVFKDGRVLVHGTDDIVKAKSLFSKYIGN